VDDLVISDSLIIPAAEIDETFARSRGPGGQNVNKTASKVQLRWNVRTSAVLSERDREWLLVRLAKQLSTRGELLISSERYRDQARNRVDARAKLVGTVRHALERPKPRRRVPLPRRAAANRLREKKRRSEVKSSRRRPEE
jgi:ribosome-associated protein